MSRHLMRGRQLSRDTEHRGALRRNMAQSLFEHGKIKTTLPKAKEVQGFVEKLITAAKRGGGEADATAKLNARRKVIALMQDRRLVDSEQEFIKKGEGARSVVEKLFDVIAPQFADRAGGYTRIIKLPQYRIGDGGSLVSLELVTEGQSPRGTARRAAGLRRQRADRKRQFLNRGGKSTKAAKTGSTGGTVAPAADQGTPAADTANPT
jgi:large subunit ribosomal protein L17